MGQVAYLTSTGEVLEAFSVTDAAWAQLCQLPRGAMVMPRSHWPATAKTSINGLRFFSHYPGYPGTLPTPESYAHTRLKIDLVRTLRSLGYSAAVEVAGKTPDGEEWVADVLGTANGDRIAFEVQLSSQHLRDFQRRTQRYSQSGVRTVWIVATTPIFDRYTKAVVKANIDYYRRTGEFLADLPEILPFYIDVPDKNAYPVRPSLRFGRGKFQTCMEMEEAVAGIMQSVPRWQFPDWKWGGHINPDIKRPTT